MCQNNFLIWFLRSTHKLQQFENLLNFRLLGILCCVTISIDNILEINLTKRKKDLKIVLFTGLQIIFQAIGYFTP